MYLDYLYPNFCDPGAVLSKKKENFSTDCVDHIYGVDQGWPHFFCGGQKNGLQKLGGHNNVSKNAWRAKFNLLKTNYSAKQKF